jgi:6-pyruvoyltetrahydropterin/6-carboxytetrahydropterin synthase
MDQQPLAPGGLGVRVLALIMAASLTRTVGFHALHRYYRPDWSEARNREVFGPLADPPGHGHDYQCSVTVGGRLDEATGMILDLSLLDAILRDEVLTPFAGKHFNLDVPAFAYGRMLPTCEAIAAYVFGRIVPRLPDGIVLERVRIMEDPTLHADCTGIA